VKGEIMSIILLKSQQPSIVRQGHELEQGQWFMDKDRSIFINVLDHRTNEKRSIKMGERCLPYILKYPVQGKEVFQVLMPGTIFQVLPNTTKEIL